MVRTNQNEDTNRQRTQAMSMTRRQRTQSVGFIALTKLQVRSTRALNSVGSRSSYISPQIRYLNASLDLQVRRHPLNHGLERALLPRLHSRDTPIAPVRKAMRAPRPVIAPVAGRELSVAQNCVRLRLEVRREHHVGLAALNEQRYVRLRVLLDVFGDFEERRVRDGGGFDDAVEGEVEDVAAWGGGKAGRG